MHINDKLKIIAANIECISQDIKEILVEIEPIKYTLKDKAIEQAKIDAINVNKRVYLSRNLFGWYTKFDAPSKYHEGKVTAIDPNGKVTILTYDGNRGDD